MNLYLKENKKNWLCYTFLSCSIAIQTCCENSYPACSSNKIIHTHRFSWGHNHSYSVKLSSTNKQNIKLRVILSNVNFLRQIMSIGTLIICSLQVRNIMKIKNALNLTSHFSHYHLKPIITRTHTHTHTKRNIKSLCINGIWGSHSF